MQLKTNEYVFQIPREVSPLEEIIFSISTLKILEFQDVMEESYMVQHVRNNFFLLVIISLNNFLFVCFFSFFPDAIYYDLGSSHGSILNGNKILCACLQPGDILEVGRSKLQFKLIDKKPDSTFEHSSSEHDTFCLLS